MAARKSKKTSTREADLFGDDNYSAKDIEVLEGLEPVRKRPGMYIGGTDEKALHHLYAEVLDNAMDEAVAGHASRIEVSLEEDGYLTVTDNGRGIPGGPAPQIQNQIRFGSYSHQPAFGCQIFQQGLCHIRGLTRGWGFGG